MCYYQTPFNIAFILDQVSNYNNLLREHMNTEKASYVRQNNMISDENIFTSKLCATANEHAPKGLDKKSIDKDIKVTNDDIWMHPKKYIPITHFLKHIKMKKRLRRIITNL